MILDSNFINTSPFNFKLWIQCACEYVSEIQIWEMDLWFLVQVHFILRYSTITLAVKLSYHPIKFEVCNDNFSTKSQCSNSSFYLTELRRTLFLCWYPLAKPVCALKGNMKFLNLHLTAGHQEQRGIQCLPNISRISPAEPKQSWGFLSPIFLYTYFVYEFTLDFRKPCFIFPWFPKSCFIAEF